MTLQEEKHIAARMYRLFQKLMHAEWAGRRVCATDQNRGTTRILTARHRRRLKRWHKIAERHESRWTALYFNINGY